MSDISFDEEETILLKLNEIETKLDKLDGQFKRNINTILKLGNTRIAKKTISIHQFVHGHSMVLISRGAEMIQ